MILIESSQFLWRNSFEWSRLHATDIPCYLAGNLCPFQSVSIITADLADFASFAVVYFPRFTLLFIGTFILYVPLVPRLDLELVSSLSIMDCRACLAGVGMLLQA
jgi:hypothetical protein